MTAARSISGAVVMPGPSPIRLRGVDTMRLAARVIEQSRRYNAAAIFVDEGGIGAGVVDRLKMLGEPVFGIQFGQSLWRCASWRRRQVANRRAEIWAIMREWPKGGAIPDDATLADDLVGVEYSFNTNDEILLERKDHMKSAACFA